MQECKVTVNITEKDMFRFLMYHQYTSMTGWLYIAIGLLTLGMGIYSISHFAPSYTLMMFLVAFFSLVYQPVGLWLKAASQVKRNEVFCKPITYIFSEEGMEVQQEESSGMLPWRDITKVAVSGDLLLIYNGKIRANLVPMGNLGTQQDALYQMIREYGPQKQRGWKKGGR